MPLDVVAAHLMRTPPSGDPWIVEALHRAASHASARGAPAGAVAYLERALAERPPAARRRELLLDIGTAESQLHSPRAAGHLREALALADDPDDAAVTALWLGQALYHGGAIDESFAIVSEVADRVAGHDSPATLELEAYLVSIATVAGTTAATAERAHALEARLSPTSPVAGAVHATIAYRQMLAGAPREDVLDGVR